MSVQYCFGCDQHIDTDFDAEHFIGEDASGNPTCDKDRMKVNYAFCYE